MVDFIIPFLSWTFSTWFTRSVTDDNLRLHCGHCSTNPVLSPLWPLLLLLPLTDAWLNSLLNFAIPASAVARTDEAALNRVDAQLEVVAGACFEFDPFLLLLFRRLLNWKAVPGLLGPGQLWSGPNRCFKQCSTLQSLHLIVFENVSRPLVTFFFLIIASNLSVGLLVNITDRNWCCLQVCLCTLPTYLTTLNNGNNIFYFSWRPMKTFIGKPFSNGNQSTVKDHRRNPVVDDFL